MSNDKTVNKTRQRLMLGAIALIFFMPIAASWLLYFFTDIGKGDAASYGELISPPILMTDRELTDPLAGGADHRLHGKWNLIYIASAACEPACRTRLGEMMELKAGLGKDAARLQLLIGAAGVNEAGALRPFLQTYSESRILLFDYVADPANSGRFERGNLYLIDPLGNLMMKYSSSSRTEGIISDLKRLLRYSRIG